MEERDAEVPLEPRRYTVGIVYNLKKGVRGKAVDAEAEYDSIETVHAIREALRRHGLNVELLEADESLFEKLRRLELDIVFNIAEGINGRGREAQIPALLNMFGIPFTGSDETTLCIALDKALTKRVLSTYRIKTPRYVQVGNDTRLDRIKLDYPVIVKPNAEGSSKGVSDMSIVESAEELQKLLLHNFELYSGDMLVEEYIRGREFTVGILGNQDNLKVFRPMEIVYLKSTQGDYCVYSYNVKQNFEEYVRYECPSSLDAATEKKMMRIARRIYEALGCLDFARVDFMLSEDHEIHFIEINPLPGLAPGYSDYPMLAHYCGVEYDDLIFEILKAGAQRYGIEL